MYGLIVDNLSYEPKMIITHIERTFKYTISYDKVWRAKQKVFKMRFGTYEASYDNLPRMLCKNVERNPGSHFEVRHFPSLIGGPSVLQRVFFCLGACVRALFDQAGPSRNASDGRPPEFESTTASRVRPRRSVSSRSGVV